VLAERRLPQEQSKAELRKQCETNLLSVDGAYLDRLVDEALGMLSNILKSQLN
jgi:hypothetical protein